MHIALVLGTARVANKSSAVAQLLKEHLGERTDATVTFVDVAAHVPTPRTMPDWADEGLDAPRQEWKEIAADADAFIFVLPEYNHGYPGEWKLLVDSTMKPYRNKPAAVVGVSSGHFGGVRMADHVKPVLVELGFRVLKTALYVTKVEEATQDGGEKAFTARLQTFVDAYMEAVTKETV